MAGEMREPENRTETIARLWKDNRWLYGLAGFLLGLVFFPALMRLDANAAELLGDFVPEAVGITFTVLVLNTLADRRVRLEKKHDLIFRMGSSRPDVAGQAVEDLRRHEWLQDGSLKGADLTEAKLQEVNLEGANLEEVNLRGANLQGANLSGINLQETYLSGANLKEAGLWGANLQGQNLSFANLQGAKLVCANLQGTQLGLARLQGAQLGLAELQEANLKKAKLQGTDLSKANLQGADLTFAHLQGANLMSANLQGANLEHALFDEETRLPDAAPDFRTNTFSSYWTPGTDMRRFTDPDHPDFWQPDWVKGKGG